MAEKRMFTMKIVDSDAFLDMPTSAQALYFHLGMRADDDGFVNNPKKIQRFVGSAEDDLKLLIAKGFIIPFENGVCVIKHWLMHNTLRKDRYNPTVYLEEKAVLYKKNNGAYSLNPEHGIPLLPPVVQSGTNPVSDGCQNDADLVPDGCQVVANMETQYRLDKGSVEEYSLEDRLEDREIDKQPEDIYMPGANVAPASQTDVVAVISLILNDKSMYPIMQKDIDRWTELYPAVNILQELRKMAGWLDGNPKKRKTKNGIGRFINAWLARCQDQGHPSQIGSQQPPQRIGDLDFIG